MLVTDMNDRERRTFAEKTDELIEAAGRLANALRTGDDDEALIGLALTGIRGSFLNELTAIFTKAESVVKIPDSPAQLIAPTRYTNPLHNRGEEGKK
jgi:hypothetical protein